MRVYFIGIGGIGVSALAQHYLEKGHEVFGFDLINSEIIEDLKKRGIKFSQNLPPKTDLIIYTSAVKQGSSFLKEAIGKGIKVKSYPEALGELTKQHFTVAVSGTHGKSTTSSMIGLILEKAGLDPTVIIGTKLKEFSNTNFRAGKSKYLVIEADEWNKSFLNYWPQIIILTNIEEEHMDTYKNLNDIIKTYKEYISHLAQDGALIANADDKNIKRIFNSKLPIFNQLSINKFSIKDGDAKKLREILKLPGEHNVYNGLAALAAAREVGVPDSISFEVLSSYRGSWRRFEEKELKLNGDKLKVIHDYGHHPTEVRETLKAAREKFKNKKIWCIFQPHQYQRTFYLFDDFAKVFSETSAEIILTDIYDVAGRESKNLKKKVSSKKLAKKARQLGGKDNIIYLPKEKIKAYLKDNLEKGDILIIMGAGDIYTILD